MAATLRCQDHAACIRKAGSSPVRNCRGTTLLEVLAAIFIMGVGMLANLTLFPLGALSIRQGINEDRAAERVPCSRGVRARTGRGR